MNEQQQPTPAQAQATAPAPSHYTARKPLRFGTEMIQPGQPVPYDATRNYAAMLQRGDIAHAAHAGADYSGPPDADHARPPAPQQRPAADTRTLTLTTGPAYFVSDDGAASPVMILRFMAADAADAEALGIALGSDVAEVTFIADASTEAPSIVPVRGLLPEQPTDRAVKDMAAFLEATEGLGLDPLSEASAYGMGEGDAVYLVRQGEPIITGTVLGIREVSEDDKALLERGFEIHERMVTLAVEGQEEREYAGLNELLPLDLAELFLDAATPDTLPQPDATASAEGAEAAEAAESEELTQTRQALSMLSANYDAVRLLLKAAIAQGDELPADMPSRATLLKTPVKTVEGLVILGSGPNGLQNLIDLDGIAEKGARKIFDYLTELGKLPAVAEG